MDGSLNNLGNPFARVSSWKQLLEFSQLSQKQCDHLKQVYALMTAGVACMGVGAYAHLAYNIGGNLTAILSLVTLLYVVFTPDPRSTNFGKRSAAFSGFAFLQGASLGPLIGHMIAVDPSILVTAIVATAAVFLCFTAAAVFAKRRSMLYLGGMLSSMCLVMFVLGITNMALRSEFLYNVQLYAGLLMFCAYVIFDTQLIVEQFAGGNEDTVSHAVQLFVDLVAIFVRLAIILLRNSNKKRRDRN